MSTTRALTAALLAAASLPAAAPAHHKIGHWSPGAGNARNAIYYVFCGNRYVRCELGDQAIRVADCETGGTFSVWAMNGQYLGIFQVSAQWRSAIPGFSFNPWAQARHAYRIYVSTGRSWGHWQCHEDGGLRW